MSINFQKAVMHKVPAHDELIRDTITAPKDRIPLPDRMATQLRNTPQLTKYDDDAYLNLSDEQNKITKERIKEVEIRNLANTTTNNYYNTHTVNKSTYEAPATAPDMPGAPPQPPPAGPPPPAAKPQMNAAGTQTIYKPTHTPSSGSGEPYFAGIGGGYQPPPAPPAAPAATVNPASPAPNFERIIEEYKIAEADIGRIRRMREDIQQQFIDDIRAEMAGRKKPVAEEMTDVVMGTGGGGPRGPPPAPGTVGYLRSAVDEIN
jgi:hypothetical protein